MYRIHRRSPLRAPAARTANGILATCTLAAALAAPANAINIVIQLDNTDDAPATDPDGSLLVAHFNAAASIWESLLPGSGTYEVDVWWEPLSGTTLGQWSPQFGGDNNIRIEPNPGTAWFFDPTPSDHSEFDFTTPSPTNPTVQGTTLYKQLTGTQQNNWFDGTGTGTLEVGYRGSAVNGGAADNRQDLLSTVIHELGHELGINGEFDGELEIFPSHIGGLDFLAFEDSDTSHIAAQIAPLMCEACGVAEVRRLPSALDVLVIANDQGNTDVNLDRLYFVQGTGATDWNASLSWVGGDVPNNSDDVFLSNGTGVFINANANAQNLTFNDSTDLHTNAHHLQVPGTTTIPTGSTLHVNAGGHAQLATVNISGTGNINMQGGTATLSFTDNDSATGLNGHGTVNVTGTFSNSGGILPSGGLLTIEGAGTMDLDGASGDGVVNVLVNDIKITTAMPEAFDGTMNINDGQTATLAEWTLGSGGDINLNGSDTTPATLTSTFGARHDLNGNVDIDRLAVISPTVVRFLQSANINLPQSNDKLTISALETDFIGASFNGLGEVEQQTNITVRDVTTVDVAEFDWGNSINGVSQHNLRVIPGTSLTIDSDTSNTATNEYRGDITLDSGTLTVNFDNPWELPDDKLEGGGIPIPRVPGRLFLENSGGGTPTINGQDLTIKNFVHVTGGPAVINANVNTSPTANFLIDSDATLTFGGDETNFKAGFFNGDGTIVQNGDIRVTNTVFMDVARFNWGNSLGSGAINNNLIIEDDINFVIRADDTGSPGNPYRGDIVILGGHLRPEFDDPWTIPDAASPGGIPLPRSALIFGFDEEQTIANSVVSGSDLIVHGDLIHLDDRADIFSNIQVHPSAAVEVGRTGTFEDAVLVFVGQAELFGGSYTGPGKLVQSSNIFIKDNTTIDVANFDWGNSFNALDNNKLNIAPNKHLIINSPDLGEADNPYRGTIDLRGKLTVNTTGFWKLPAPSGTSTLIPGGTLEFRDNRIPGDDPPTIAGRDLHVHGKVFVSAELAVTENYFALIDGSTLAFDDTSTLRFDHTLEINDVILDHDDALATLTSDGTGLLNWGLNAHPTVIGATEGSLTFDLPAGTPVAVPNILSNTITIDPGATLHIAGLTDPLTSTTNPALHVSVINNSSTTFRISNPNVTTDTVTGIGFTHVLPGGTLSVESIAQDRINIDPGGTMNLTVDDTTIVTTNFLTNYGTVNLAGTTTVTGPASGAGDFNVPAAETLLFNDPVNTSGNYPGPGTVTFRNDFDPNGDGSTTGGGTNTFGGPVILGSSTTLIIDTFTPDPADATPTEGTHYDRLVITGPVTLSGTLELTHTLGGALFDIFPVLGTEYPVMTYAERTGERTLSMFDAINGALINTSFALAPLFTDTDESGNDDSLILRATIPGDLNLDNKVSVADLSTFALNFGTTPGLHDDDEGLSSWRFGDFNADGAVTVADLSLLALNFGFELLADGTTTPPTPLSITAIAQIAGIDPATVPEPASVAILFAVAAACPRRSYATR